jgi:hypothetical protein
MTPTWTLLLFAFVFWTYPATAAVIVYRLHGSSVENVKDALRTSFQAAAEALRLDLPSLRVPSLRVPDLDAPAPQVQSEG